ncbi:MAG: DUF4129 domain-containing protein [Candidatus Thermoplasmatota archaeon]
MDLQFDRKEMFFVGIVLLMILAWTLGNLGVAYFGMQDEDIGGEAEQPDYADGDTAAFDIPVKMVRYFFYGILVAGALSIFIGPKEDIKKTILNHIPRLGFIAVLFFLPEMLPYIKRAGKWLNRRVISDIELPSMPEVFPETGSQQILSPFGSSIGVLILLGAILVIVFFIIRHKHASEESSETEEEISSTADKAITELHEGDDVRDVIIRNYQKMLIRLEEEGVHQDLSFTPRELEKMALAKLTLTEETIDEMTELFEEAKYSDHPLGEKERDRAIDNFKQIREELGGDKDA